jgi:transaldolase/glucose-6-phosphate isomerase
MNTLIELLNYGQSYWLDNLTREKISGGELKKRVSDQGLRGITSNPSIFDKAISGSNDYETQIKVLANSGKSPEQIYDALTIKDVQDACDILKSVYDQSAGVDGFVSLEVPPYLACDTQGTITEARRLFAAVDRPNCLIKIPGTREGIPAIEQMLYEGVNINITLLFSMARYEEIAHAYIRSIDRRVREGKSVNTIISVASIFISRIDVLVDQLIGQRLKPLEDNKATHPPELMFGRAGVATARLSYQCFKKIFSGEEWKRLENKGAHVQRPLWASTSNKDFLYSDLRYVEPMIGTNTINTLPDETILAFAEHGKIKKDSIEDEVEQAKELFREFTKLDIDIDSAMRQLEIEGIRKFMEAYNKLIGNIADKRQKVLAEGTSSQQWNCGKLETEIRAVCTSMDEKQTGRLLFAESPFLWKSDPKQIKEISKCLDWLTLPERSVENMLAFALNLKEEGYTHAVLLGMGGSSLCSEVARETFGTAKGYLQLLVLDNTDPEAIREVENKINITKTIFIVASKSGNTKETLSFFRYFYHQLNKKGNSEAGTHFIAITDPETPLVKIAEQYKFRKTFLNPPNLGGRYSVLSDFGLVPMALIGADIKSMLSSARQMENSCNGIPAASNPGISLGVVLGICQRHGRDKVTFVLSSSLRSFGFWVEQLLAESTGKEGRGLIPVNGEKLGAPEIYGGDRIFIHLYMDSDNNEAEEAKVKALEKAGHPIVRIRLANKIALGGEYYRWEIAAAIAGKIIGINPFDQPNVEESKKNTAQLLEGWEKQGSFSNMTQPLKIKNISIYIGSKSEKVIVGDYKSIGDFLNSFMRQVRPNDYIALLPYFLMTEHRTGILQSWRTQMRDQLKIATTLLNGPRYLHSTGQLHKGGPDTGIYIILVGDENEDLEIPGEKFGFATLHQAQALGDFRSLDEKGRRVIRIHLGKNIDAGLDELSQSISSAERMDIQQNVLQ